MFKKGMYVIWPDERYIDQAVAAGIDTLVFNLNDGTPKVETERLCQKYHDRGVTVVPTIALVQPNYILEEDEQFFNGSFRNRHYYCPTSQDRVDKLLSFPLQLCRSGAADAVGIDDEDYIPGTKYHEEYNQHQCQCERCKGLSVDQQRTTHAGMIKKALGDIPLYHFPHVNPYIWRIGSWWWNEYTYEKWGEWDRIVKNTNKMKCEEDICTLNSSGIWAEKFPARDYMDKLMRAVKSPATDGYWIYSHMRFSRNSYWRLHPDDPTTIETLKTLPFKSYIDEDFPEFFQELKRLNSRIDDLRSGFMFSIMNIIYSFFR